MIWARDFVSDQVMEIPEYLVYFGISMMQSWDKRSGQIAKGEFLEVPKLKMGAKIPQQSSSRSWLHPAATIIRKSLQKGRNKSRGLNPYLSSHPYSVSR